MADIALTSANIRALVPQGAVTIPGTAGATLTVGYLVYQANDGDWEHADGNVDTTLAKAQGVVVQSYDGEDTVAAGNACTICKYGPISGYTGLTAGANYYLSDTVGRIGDAVGAYDRIIGHGVEISNEVCLWVDIQQNDPSSA